ncbi:hypothetical protein ES319_D07G212200v1 [Gossypium barbadense]|uniref:Uncharacterized protein n=1 Tax=Gossypium barbadense TaxID=3634 RepID=A0A5J5QVA2_GOSBA|nr:hypothetical protein ES319_D07G212200v1 [Gossypium barbadense]
MINRGHTWCKILTNFMEENQNKSNSMLVHGFTRMDQTFIVAKMVSPHEGVVTRTYLVYLNQRWCDYRRFQALRFPCAHELDGLQNVAYWQTIPNNIELLPNLLLRRNPNGHQKSSHIHTEMDIKEERQCKHYGFCRNKGDNRNSFLDI